jgi:D-alanine-D-alanine ligase
VRPRSVVIAHNAVGSDDDPSTSDVLAQVAWAGEGLAGLGVPYTVLPVDRCGPDSTAVARPGVVVFNLVESPPGRPRFQVEAAAAFERLGVPYTGSDADTIWLTTDKLATRVRLSDHGIPVAPGGELDPEHPEILERVPPPWILKPALEDASVGINGGAVTSDRSIAVSQARALAARFGEPVLVERLLDGREFNLSLLAAPDGIEVLPLAEMLFVDFAPDRPKVVDWAAKWDQTSFAYRHTVRRFLAPGEDDDLARRLEVTARAAGEACGVAGYARVDLRLDDDGVPCVLEVNANPCLSADAGFVAAAAAAGIDPPQVVARILAAAANGA